MEAAAGFKDVPNGPTSAAVANNSQYLIFNNNGVLSYWKWNLKSQKKVTPVEVMVKAKKYKIPADTPIEAATTENQELRVYVIDGEKKLVELNCDKNDKWTEGDLTEKYYEVTGNAISVVPKPIQIVFKNPDAPTALSVAYVGDEGWQKDPLNALVMSL